MPPSRRHRENRAKRKRRESPSSTTAGSANTVHKTYNQGNLEIISSDGVIFKVNPVYLCAGRTVEPTDDINEKASILEVFSNVLHGKPILESVGSTWFTKLQRLIALVEKTHSYYHIFMLLARLGDVEGCAAAIRFGGHESWNRPESSPDVQNNARQLQEHLYKVGWANPTSWTLGDASKVDFRFYCALSRAFKVSNATHPLDTKQLEKIAKEFCRLLGKDTRSPQPQPRSVQLYEYEMSPRPTKGDPV
ncbi:hypothetical protein JCM24511_05805 [Saitozyma sp. JCM 24511]|nr:hypothetical protein JCM24511_05805 [Saitozyma sp. JCM 24511]